MDPVTLRQGDGDGPRGQGGQMRPGVAERINRALSDPVMGFLGLVSLFLGFAPAVFEPGAVTLRTIMRVELGIVLLFGVEYAAGLWSAPSKTAFIRNPWRVLDGLIVVFGLVSVFEPLQGLLRNAPALRLIRIGRLVLFGVRTGTALVGNEPMSSGVPGGARSGPEIHLAVGEESLHFESVDWETALERVRSDSRDWIFASGIDAGRIGALAAALDVSEQVLRTRLFESALPRIERMERYTALFTWYPTSHRDDASERLRISRSPVLVVGSFQNVVVLTLESTDLVERTSREVEDLDPALPPLLRLTYALLKAIVRRYERITEQMVTSLMRIESAQSVLGDRAFLDRTFHLRGEVSRIRVSVRHLREVLHVLAAEPVAIRGFEAENRPLFVLLADDANEVYQSVDDLMDSLSALVDLRLNVASFQMNKVMRLLAILTTLTLIPAVTGGLLGMNLAGSPWNASLMQVAFGVAAGMALSLYVFATKGWLR